MNSQERSGINRTALLHLSDRAILRVAGPEAAAFLQGLVTCDMREMEAGVLRYGCLLTPQGNMLHDFFVFAEDEVFYLDTESGRRGDLLHRLGLYRLRAKVSIEDVSPMWSVFAIPAGPAASDRGGDLVFDDPRMAGLQYKRMYAREKNAVDARDVAAYGDYCITQGLPLASRTFIPEKDIAADINLDLLHAIAWDKGCYVGQEVTARVHFRGLVKKRLMIVEGHGLVTGSKLGQQGGGEAGEIRTVSSDGSTALAIVRMSIFENRGGIFQVENMSSLIVKKPKYLSTVS